MTIRVAIEIEGGLVRHLYVEGGDVAVYLLDYDDFQGMDLGDARLIVEDGPPDLYEDQGSVAMALERYRAAAQDVVDAAEANL